MVESQIIERPYGTMFMLAGGTNLRTQSADLRIIKMRPETVTSHHYHDLSESIFHVQDGEVELTVAGRSYLLGPGDTVVIEAGEDHVLRALGPRGAEILEVMSPPYSSRDTFDVGEIAQER